MIALNLLVLRCRDLEASRRFYEALDLRFTKHAHGSGPEHLAHEDERGVFELYPAAGTEPGDRTGLGFGFHDLDKMFNRLQESGFSPQPIRQNPWGRTFVVRDPDDRRVELKQTNAVN
jgi:catechol 2,3-dioxygenase-like lactoylglutathione lyase family enzyme